MRTIIRLLRQRYPAHDDPGEYLWTITLIAVLVFLILGVFTPFNFQRFPEQRRWLMALLYSGTAYLTMLVCAAWIILFPNVFKAATWTLGKELLIVVYQFTTVSFSVWLLARYVEGTNRSYGYTWSVVAVGGILPYLVATSLKHVYHLKRNLREAMAIQHSLLQRGQPQEVNLLTVPGLLVPLAVCECLFVRAEGNYLHIVVEKMETIHTHVVRLPLHKFMEDNPFPELFKCHRTYAVNLTQVSRVSGNAAGYSLLLRNELPEVPVSRANVPKLKQLLATVPPDVWRKNPVHETKQL